MSERKRKRPKSEKVPRDEPQEWKAATERAQEIRVNVGQQLAALVAEADITGSGGLIAKRVRGIVEAEGSGDQTLVRAAAMELAVAAAAFAVGIDVREAEREQRSVPAAA